MNKAKSDRITGIAIHLAVYIFLVFFFFRISPLIVYDIDDWVFLGDFGRLYPKWHGWNPTRLFCVNIMPLGGRVGALLYPITGDYVNAITLSSALFLSAFIVAMCHLFRAMIEKRYELSFRDSLLFEGLFLASFFLIFRNKPSSSFMFHAADLCCVYFYLMSGLLNACVVLYMMRFEDGTEGVKSHLLSKIIFIAALYFALFSNIFHSAMTAIYCGATLLCNALWQRKNKSPAELLRQNAGYIITVILWLIVLLFEKNGGRAGSVGEPLDMEIAFRQVLTMVKAISVPYMIIILVAIACFVFGLMKQRGADKGLVIVALSLVVITFYLFLLSSVIHYFSRIEASWATWFFLILFCILALIRHVRNVGFGANALLPAVFAIVVLLCILPDGKYRISSDRNTDYDSCYKASAYMSGRIIDADRNGETTIILPVPRAEGKGEFTFCEGVGNNISHTLYVQGVISKEISVTETVDDSLSAEFFGQ